MSDSSFDAFRAHALAQGFDEVLERVWGPDHAIPEHAHPFEVMARVVSGEFVLVCGGAERHLREGESFGLARDTPHAERYGAAGTTLWVARRHRQP